MASNPRTPRDQESRLSEQRIDYAPPDLLPVPDPEPGISFRWVATHNRGEHMQTNVSRKFREGWSPVKASDYPKIAESIGAAPNGNIEMGGLVLCKMDSERVEARRRYYANMAQRQMQAVNSQYMEGNNPLMPKFQKVKSRVELGRGFGKGS
jgi:hypothetical protein